MQYRFLHEKAEQLPPHERLPLAFFDAVHLYATKYPDEDVAFVVLNACKLCEISLSDEEIAEVAQHLVSEAEKPAKKVKDVKTFSSAVAKWFASLNGEQTALFVADFDVAKARDLYFNEPKSIVTSALHLKIEYLMERFRVEYEASLYGFGGKYDGDTSGAKDGADIDLTENFEEGLAALKKLGF